MTPAHAASNCLWGFDTPSLSTRTSFKYWSESLLFVYQCRFVRNKPALVCGNTAAMLQETWLVRVEMTLKAQIPNLVGILHYTIACWHTEHTIHPKRTCAGTPLHGFWRPFHPLWSVWLLSCFTHYFWRSITRLLAKGFMLHISFLASMSGAHSPFAKVEHWWE